MKNKILALLMTLIMLVGLIPVANAANVSVTGVTVNKDFTYITVGVIETLAVTVSPSNATNKNVTWTSSNPNYASVDADGNVTAKRPGKVTITATTVDGGYRASCTFDVVSLEDTQITRDTVLILDDSGSMRGTPIAELKSAAVNFATKLFENPGINRLAVITYTERVASTLNFTTDISSVKSVVNAMGASGGTNITEAVKKANEYLTASTADIKNMIIMTDGLPENGESVASGRYTSSDHSYCYSYANALYNTCVEYHSEYRVFTFGFFHSMSGSTEAFASKLLDDIKNARFYKVIDGDDLDDAFGEIFDDLTETSVTLDKQELRLSTGEKAQLTAKVHAAANANKTVYWKSADPSIAVVDGTGLVKAVSIGETTITVTTQDGEHSASCRVIVEEDESDPMLIGGTVKTRPGKTVRVPISLDNNPGIAGVSFRVRFDSSVLTLTEVDLGSEEANWEYVNHSFGNTDDYDSVSFSYARKTNYFGNNVLATLVFTVDENAAPGYYDIEIYYYDACDQDLNDVFLRLVDGTVYIRSSIPGDINRDDVINTKDAVLLAQYLAKWDVEIDELAADCNADGVINTKDAVLLSQYLAKWDVTLG